MTDVCAVSDQELNGLLVALRCGDTECGSAVIVVGVDLPAGVLEDRHVLCVVFEGSIEETVVVVSQGLQLDGLIG